jgi:uncharacterized membrane protein YhaH (DUF805 family)
MSLIFVSALYIGIFGEAPSQVLEIAATVIVHIIGLFLMVAITSLLKRRMHDLGLSGAVVGLLPFILFISNFARYLTTNTIVVNLIDFLQAAGLIIYIVLGCIKGQRCDNAYGPDPLQ